MDCREGCARMMHVLENVFSGYRRMEFDLGEVSIQNWDCSWRWVSYGRCATNWWHFIQGYFILYNGRDRDWTLFDSVTCIPDGPPIFPRWDLS